MALWVRTLLFTGPEDEVAAAVPAHREHLRSLHERGTLRAAGRLAKDGFLEIFEAVDRREAEAIAADSPLIEQGLASWLLREWIEVTFDR